MLPQDRERRLDPFAGGAALERGLDEPLFLGVRVRREQLLRRLLAAREDRLRLLLGRGARRLEQRGRRRPDLRVLDVLDLVLEPAGAARDEPVTGLELDGAAVVVP